MTFITSNKWTRAGYGEALRKFILEKTTLQSYIDFNGEQVFESATVDTSITTFLKLPPTPSHQVAYLSCVDSFTLSSSKPDSIPQSSLSIQTLTFSSSSVMALKEKIESIGTPLKEWDITINYGIKTGYNEAFIITTEKREEILRNCKTQEEKEATEQIIKKMLRGRDIKRYSYEWADLWIIGTFPSLKLNIDDYPSLKSYLSQFRPKINQSGEKGCRKKTSNQWFETQDQIAYYKDFDQNKIIWAELARTGNSFVIDRKMYSPLAGSFILTLNDETQNLYFMNAVLNNPICLFYLEQVYSKLDDTGWQWKKAPVEKIPIPKITESNKPTADKIIVLTEKILEQKEQDPSSSTQELESQIDSLVYTLYNLTDEEIKIIEGEK